MAWIRACYANVHGITCFWRQDGIDGNIYNLDSRKCTAETLWDCFAEAGKKTLVYNWPGCGKTCGSAACGRRS